MQQNPMNFRRSNVFFLVTPTKIVYCCVLFNQVAMFNPQTSLFFGDFQVSNLLIICLGARLDVSKHVLVSVKLTVDNINQLWLLSSDTYLQFSNLLDV